MSDAIIVQFDIHEVGKHLVVRRDHFEQLLAPNQNGLNALIKAVGAASVVGLIIKTHRLRGDYTTRTLAQKTKISESTVNRLEKGTKNLTATLLQKLEAELPGLTRDLLGVGFSF